MNWSSCILTGASQPANAPLQTDGRLGRCAPSCVRR